MSSGLAKRTLKNLDFIKNASCPDDDDPCVHPVTQVVNSLLCLLVFPIEKEKEFLKPYSKVLFPKFSCSQCGATKPDLSIVRAELAKHGLELNSLEVTEFDRCPTMSDFFRKIRNSVSHKRLEFSSESRVLADVIVTLKDCKTPTKDEEPRFDWEISMTAADLETLGRFIADRIIKLGL
jgi:hypothetical protein